MYDLLHGKIFCENTMGFFGHSLNKIQTLPKEECEALQLSALQYRFEQLRDAIPVVKQLADNEGVHKIDTLNDVVPLLFEHTVYKSYPPSLLYNNHFGKLTQWLNKLTTVDLSGFDASNCHNLDEWINELDAQTPLTLIHSSGTSGVFSFMPKTKKMYEKFMDQYRVSVLQEFGKESGLVEFPLNIDAIYPYYRYGNGHLHLNDLYVQYICGSEDRFHAAYPGRLSSDILLLSSRIAAATAKGELDRLEISPDLLTRRDEFLEMQKHREENVAQFFDEITDKLKGKRIFMQAVPGMLYQMADAGLKRGGKGIFAADSIIIAGGGFKGSVIPDNWADVVKEYLGVDRIIQLYGMTEMSTFFPACEYGHHHTMPGIIPFILDPDTSEPLPRTGRVTGRWAHFDLVPDTWWGGFISGDEVTMNWDIPCPCGRSTAYLEKNIQRYSDKKRGGDKITCAATADAYQEAMDFLADFTG